MKVLVLGGAEFIGSHVARRLKLMGHEVCIADISDCKYWKETEICDTFQVMDLRVKENVNRIIADQSLVLLSAADMGGMGFIAGNSHSICQSNTFNVMDACVLNITCQFNF